MGQHLPNQCGTMEDEAGDAPGRALCWTAFEVAVPLKGKFIPAVVAILTLGLQSKLLRVIEEGECEWLGGTRTIKSDVRLLCATAKDLKQEVEGGRFRQGLLYRLSVIPLFLPPLRQRVEDSPLLVNHFLGEFSRKRGVAPILSALTLQCLLSYQLPGNARELKNIIERVSELSPGPIITLEDLPADLRGQPLHGYGAACPLRVALAGAEKHCILNALAHCDGHRTRAAESLRSSRKNLWEKMKLHAIEF